MELDSRIAAQLADRVAGGPHPTDQQFRLLVNSVTDYAIFLLDPEGRVVSWNPGAERIKGYPARDILGRHFSLFFPPEERAAGMPERLLFRAAREGRAEHEGWRVRADGTRFWADGTITALRAPTGELTGYAKVTRDMTARERLREQETMLAAMFERTPIGIVLLDGGGACVRANPSFQGMLGYGEAELERRGFADLAHPEEVEATWRLVEDLVQGRRSHAEHESRFLRRNGQAIWVRASAARLPDAEGRLRYLMVMAEDVSERRRAYEALREQRTLLAEAQKVAGLGSWEWEPTSGRMVWSDELYRIYGLEPAALQPTFEGYLERVHPEDRDVVAAMVARGVAEGGGFRFDERIVRPDGEVRQLRSHGEVVRDEGGRPRKVVGACLDVTEHKAAEAALRALSRRLVQAEENERRRIARELHDRVGQNLSALNINLDILLGRLDEPALRKRLEDSLALVDATLQSIENVMADLRPPLLDEYGLGAALGWYGGEYAQRTGIRVVVGDAGPDRGLRPEAAVALFRIAQEALNNVAKHAGASLVAIDMRAERGELTLSVRDDGCGFETAAAPRARWGMSTMRERAEAAGGRLSVESAPGKGTTVRATVPL